MPKEKKTLLSRDKLKEAGMTIFDYEGEDGLQKLTNSNRHAMAIHWSQSFFNFEHVIPLKQQSVFSDVEEDVLTNKKHLFVDLDEPNRATDPKRHLAYHNRFPELKQSKEALTAASSIADAADVDKPDDEYVWALLMDRFVFDRFHNKVRTIERSMMIRKLRTQELKQSFRISSDHWWENGKHLLENNRKLRGYSDSPALSAPKPDLYFSFRIHRYLEDEAWYLYGGSTLQSFAFEKIRSLARLSKMYDAEHEQFHPCPIRNYAKRPSMDEKGLVAFPWLIGEWKHGGAVKDVKTQVRHQAANGCAVALTMLARLATHHRRAKIPETIRPVFAITTIGPTSSLWVAFVRSVDSKNGALKFEMHRIWTGDISKQLYALELSLFLDKLHSWAMDDFRQWIAECIEEWHHKLETHNDANQNTNKCNMEPTNKKIISRHTRSASKSRETTEHEETTHYELEEDSEMAPENEDLPVISPQDRAGSIEITSNAKEQAQAKNVEFAVPSRQTYCESASETQDESGQDIESAPQSNEQLVEEVEDEVDGEEEGEEEEEEEEEEEGGEEEEAGEESDEEPGLNAEQEARHQAGSGQQPEQEQVQRHGHSSEAETILGVDLESGTDSDPDYHYESDVLSGLDYRYEYEYEGDPESGVESDYSHGCEVKDKVEPRPGSQSRSGEVNAAKSKSEGKQNSTGGAFPEAPLVYQSANKKLTCELFPKRMPSIFDDNPRKVLTGLDLENSTYAWPSTLKTAALKPSRSFNDLWRPAFEGSLKIESSRQSENQLAATSSTAREKTKHPHDKAPAETTNCNQSQQSKKRLIHCGRDFTYVAGDASSTLREIFGLLAPKPFDHTTNAVSSEPPSCPLCGAASASPRQPTGTPAPKTTSTAQAREGARISRSTRIKVRLPPRHAYPNNQK